MTKKYGKCPKCGYKHPYLLCDPFYFDLYSICCPICNFCTDNYIFPEQAEKEWNWLRENPERISLPQLRAQICEKIDRVREKLEELKEIKFCSTELKKTFVAVNELYKKINGSKPEDLRKCQNPPKERTESDEKGSNFNVSGRRHINYR